jgi:uncharacterized protein (UPF0335 family)
MESHAITKEHLLQIISKLERLEGDKSAVAEDIKEVCAEARSNGFDIMTIKKILKIRKMDKDKLQEQEELLDLYMSALGM